MNSILGKIGVKSSAVLTCSLIDIHCVPILLYASEAVPWSKKDLNSMSFAYNQPFVKIFNSSDKDIIRSCQFYMNVLPFDLLLDVRRLNFLERCGKNKNSFVDSTVDVDKISSKYFPFRSGVTHINWKRTMWKFFQNSIAINASD